VGEEADRVTAHDDRFLIQARLGAGGMGVVYRALDRTRGNEVAIKFLRRLDGDALYRFKNEFRTLADLSHPNLLSLHELLSFGDEWYFTMDLIDGLPFDEFLGVAPTMDDLSPTEITVESGPDHRSIAQEPEPPAPLARPPPFERRTRLTQLWPLLGQLVEGVQALHRAGKLHRDIKPSNVLVTRTGKLVLCDFGLIAEVPTTASDRERSLDHRVVGTPNYMSPEQAVGLRLSEATDWYSVGVMLYQALTGRLPFTGEASKVLWMKSRSEPPTPRELDPEVPAELDALCMALLRRDPAARATGKDILAVLGHPAPTPRASTDEVVATGTPFVGRAHEEHVLRAALAASRQGHSVTVFVHGSSGIGKTALVRRFLGAIRDSESAVVLAGRCYERESVPYKALDTIVDAMSTHLRRLARAEVEEVLPEDVSALVRLFPVLRRVEAIAEAGEPPLLSPDPHESRRRAFGALRHMLQRLSERQPLVLFIDDLQWGDMDSAPFLADLIYLPDAPQVLLVACMRGEEVATSPLLQLLRDPKRAAEAGAERLKEIALEPLTPAEAEALSREALQAKGHAAELRAARIAHESGGSPLFVLELARADVSAEGPTPGLRLERVLLDRIGRLPEPARVLLASVALAGRPTPQPILERCVGSTIPPALVNLLRSARLLRTRRHEGDLELESYHDRIREALVGQMTADERRQVHHGLATAFEERADADPQTLVEHWIGAGEDARAGRHALVAAARAEEALAFHRAAHYYELALKLIQHDPADARRLEARLASALAHAGRLADAAAVSLRAAEGAEAGEALELRRQAMESLLLAGRLQEGLVIARIVARAVRLPMPRTPRSALVSLLLRRLTIRMRGLGFEERRAEDISPEVLQRIDVCWSLASGLSFVDTLRATCYQARYLSEALGAGDVYRAALALNLESGFRAIGGTRAWAHLEPLLLLGREFAVRTANPQAIAYNHATAGVAHFLCGRWRTGLERMQLALKMWRDHGTEMRWGTDLCQVFQLSSMLQLGETREMLPLLELYLQEALERGDQYAATALRSWRGSAAWLIGDRPDVARRQALESSMPAIGRGFHTHHYYELVTHCQIDQYTGDFAGSWRRIEGKWSDLGRSSIVRVQMARIESNFLRARCALGWAAASPAEREATLAVAARCVQRIRREHAPWGDAVVVLLRACISAVRGEREAAAELLADADSRLTAVDMALLAAVARRRRGELLGGDEGRSLVDDATQWMKHQGVVKPARIAAMYAPGFSPASL